jgi:hypothetical protein
MAKEHHQEHEHNESEGGRRKHHFAQHKKHGGHVKHHGKHHKAGGGKLPEKADGNPFVLHEAEEKKSVGKIGGVKGKKRLDRKHGGACHKHGGHAHEDGMPKVHHGHGGIAAHHSLAGGHHHKGHHHVAHHHHASGGATGADNAPYSSAGRELRGHKHGGALHHGSHHGHHGSHHHDG